MLGREEQGHPTEIVSRKYFAFDDKELAELMSLSAAQQDDKSTKSNKSKKRLSWSSQTQEFLMNLNENNNKKRLVLPKCQLILDFQVRAQYKMRGGLLADRMGFGKTSTTIGLMAARERCALPPIPLWWNLNQH